MISRHAKHPKFLQINKMRKIQPSRLARSCFNILCLPPLEWLVSRCLDYCFRQGDARRAARRDAQRRRRLYIPREAPLPLSPRKHRLSFMDNSTDLAEQQQAFDQAQSRFLSLLPKEVRLQMYEDVLGGRLIHLMFEDYDIRRSSYLRRSRCVPGCDAYTWDHYSSCWGDGERLSLPENLLPLLQSCRIVYVILRLHISLSHAQRTADIARRSLSCTRRISSAS